MKRQGNTTRNGRKLTIQVVVAVALWFVVSPTLAEAIPLFDGLKYRVGESKVEYTVTGYEGVFSSSSVNQRTVNWDVKFPFALVFRGSRLWDAINLDFTPFFDFSLARELEVDSTLAGAKGTTEAEQLFYSTNPNAFFQSRVQVSTFGVGGAFSVFLGGGNKHFLKLAGGLVAGMVYYDGEMKLCEGRSAANPCEGERFVEDNAGWSDKIKQGTVYSLTLFEWEGPDYSLSLYTKEVATVPVEFNFDLKQSTRPEGIGHKLSLDATFSSIEYVSFTYWF